ncbi:rCG62947 [Rattus norvegicus]|uniref:RCG62947 n=1 Tax=Rattus norvegicus TaxID=10116 RepID=A6JM07_RAT|nr:rCG62947 [Rattus norvegicus]
MQNSIAFFFKVVFVSTHMAFPPEKVCFRSLADCSHSPVKSSTPQKPVLFPCFKPTDLRTVPKVPSPVSCGSFGRSVLALWEDYTDSLKQRVGRGGCLRELKEG